MSPRPRGDSRDAGDGKLLSGRRFPMTILNDVVLSLPLTRTSDAIHVRNKARACTVVDNFRIDALSRIRTYPRDNRDVSMRSRARAKRQLDSIFWRFLNFSIGPGNRFVASSIFPHVLFRGVAREFDFRQNPDGDVPPPHLFSPDKILVSPITDSHREILSSLSRFSTPFS